MSIRLPDYTDDSEFKDEMGAELVDIIDTAAPIQTDCHLVGTPITGRVYVRSSRNEYTLAVIRYIIVHEGDYLPDDEGNPSETDEIAGTDVINFEVDSSITGGPSGFEITLPFDSDFRPFKEELEAFFKACINAAEAQSNAESSSGFIGAGTAVAVS